MRLLCKLLGHRWYSTYVNANIYTGEGIERYHCKRLRCKEVREDKIPPRGWKWS